MNAAARFVPALAALLVAGAVPAQTLPPGADPGAIQQRRMEQERLLRQEEELRRKRIDKPVPAMPEKPAAKPATGEDVRFLVRAIEFGPSELLSREELEGLAAPYRGRSVSLAELRALVESINALYRGKGIVTAQAILPPQDVSDGIVRIRLIEGRVGKVSVRGNATTDAGYVAARIRQGPGDLVRLPELERDLKRFNRTNDVQARAQLEPGAEVGQTDIVLLLEEPPLHELRAFTDNSGSVQTGEVRAGVSYRNRSLHGLRDDLTLSTAHADGQASYSVAWGVPVSTLGTRLNAAYYDDATHIKHGPLAVLDLKGKASATVLSLRHPLRIDDASQVDAILGAKQRRTLNRFDAVVLQKTRTRDASLGLEGQFADPSGYWLGSITGLVVDSEQLNLPERSFRVVRGTLRRSHNLPQGLAVVASYNWQNTGDDLLPAGEQFLIGGEGSVRGYAPGVLSGDRGYVLSLELHHPIPTGNGEGPALKASGFIFSDYGVVRPFRPPSDPREGRESLSSIGWGVSVQAGPRLSLRATLGFPMHDRPEEPRNARVHVQLSWSIL